MIPVLVEVIHHLDGSKVYSKLDDMMVLVHLSRPGVITADHLQYTPSIVSFLMMPFCLKMSDNIYQMSIN